MRYEFPKDITLDEVREVIARHNERTDSRAFIEADRGDHVIFNYVVAFEHSFPPPYTGDPALDREYAILRECRGLTFCTSTGRIIARKYNKFFNLNEKPETQANVIDWSIPHEVLEKLDGSMITPFYAGDIEDIAPEKIRWATKMGLTDVAKPVEEYVSTRPHIAAWAAHTMYGGHTPIFEWCSRKQRIVVDYPEDRLVLTAIRNNRTGEYLGREAMLAAERSGGVEIVRALPGSIENLEQFMAEAQDLEGAEGYVIRFATGHMLKVKGAWYCQIHRTKELLTLEKDVLALIVEDRLDDAKAFMDDSDRSRVEAYHEAISRALAANVARLEAIIAQARVATGGDKKLFATQFMPSLTLAEHESTILFQLWDGKDGADVVRRLLAKNVGTGPRVDTIRHLLGGIRWDEFKDPNAVTGED
jgi:T4 RnlA family RNA ligase